MRHRKKINHLGRTHSHRKAMLANMACSLIEHKRIQTTVAKAKALRVYVEPLVTKSKNDSMHSRRVVFSYLKNKYAVQELFGEIRPKILERPGGYTRILKIGNRKGDNAEMALIEFVDFNELAPGKVAAKGSSKKRRRRGGKKKAGDQAAVQEAPKQEASATPDDLTKVEGIGPKIQEALNAAGIVSFAELAEAGADRIKEILTEAGGSLKSKDPSTWSEQAQMAADGKWDELKAWQDELDGGKVVEEAPAEEESEAGEAAPDEEPEQEVGAEEAPAEEGKNEDEGDEKAE